MYMTSFLLRLFSTSIKHRTLAKSPETPICPRRFDCVLAKGCTLQNAFRLSLFAGKCVARIGYGFALIEC